MASNDANNRPMAKIPWIPVETSDGILEEGSFFKKMKASTGKVNLKLYRLLNQIFPFYLPKRFRTSI